MNILNWFRKKVQPQPKELPIDEIVAYAQNKVLKQEEEKRNAEKRRVIAQRELVEAIDALFSNGLTATLSSLLGRLSIRELSDRLDLVIGDERVEASVSVTPGTLTIYYRIARNIDDEPTFGPVYNHLDEVIETVFRYMVKENERLQKAGT